MKTLSLVSFMLVLVGLGACSRFTKPGDVEWQNSVSRELEAKTKSPEAAKAALFGGERALFPLPLSRFYRARAFHPAWVTGPNSSGQASELIDRLQKASEEGLNPDHYHLASLKKLEDESKKARTAQEGAILGMQRDALLSDAFLAHTHDLSRGALNPGAMDPNWAPERDPIDLAKMLEEAISEHHVGETLDKLVPQTDGYRTLKAGLLKYRKIAESGGWKIIPAGKDLRVGIHDPRVPLVRRRLTLTDEFRGDEDSDLYDEGLASAVTSFQLRHGLKGTGQLDSVTTAEMNVSAQARADEIRVSLERWRWLPRFLGDRYVFIDIAGFKLTVFDRGRAALSMPVVVGKDTDPTPVFDDEISYLVLNPTWTVPKSIIMDELVPRLRTDPSYLEKKDLKVYDRPGKDGREIASSAIDWSKVEPQNWKYFISQAAGPRNPLGKIKFMFPNRFSVYVHGTPVRKHFSHAVRSESHGCVRVERPLELAAYLLQENNPPWTIERIQEALKEKDELAIKLKSPVPVHLFYWTAWVDNQGQIEFRKDVYGWNVPVQLALERAQQTAARVGE